MQVHEMIRDYYPEYYSIEHYPSAETICIRKTTDEWGIFGNFYKTPIVVNGITFDCTERLFQMMKLKQDVAEAFHTFMSFSCDIFMKNRATKCFNEHPEWFHDHWPSMVVDAMKYCLTLKYEQSEAFRKELEQSKGKYIVEDETSRKKGKDADTWGAVLKGDEYVGPNLLGRLLMELRDNGHFEFKNKPEINFTL